MRSSLTHEIARKVRDLRQSRRWTQRELAEQLGTSQSRLSELEAGAGSFSAEQFLTVLRLFNVTTDHFASTRPNPADTVHQALARLGASHLLVTDTALPSERLAAVADGIREALTLAEPRLLTALAPVIVVNIDKTNFAQLYQALRPLGLEHRLGWVIDNVHAALGHQPPLRAARTPNGRRARVVLARFLATAAHPPDTVPLDLVDGTIRTDKTIAVMTNQMSNECRRWRVLSSLTAEDFAGALEAADVGR